MIRCACFTTARKEGDCAEFCTGLEVFHVIRGMQHADALAFANKQKRVINFHVGRDDQSSWVLVWYDDQSERPTI